MDSFYKLLLLANIGLIVFQLIRLAYLYKFIVHTE